MYLTQSLHRAAQQHPGQLAVRDGDRSLSFAELRDRVARLAGVLQALGMEPGDRVAILALNSVRYLEYQMAVPWGGGVLNPCNIRWSAAEIAYSLQDSDSRLLLVDDTFVPMVSALQAEVPTLTTILHIGGGPTPDGLESYPQWMARTAPVADMLRRDEDLAGVFYTGGTTGFPKGVMLSHANLVSSGLALCGEGAATPGGCYLHAAPMFHLADVGIAQPHWLLGNAHAMVPAFTPERVIEAIARERVTDVLLVPTMIQLLVDHPAMKTAPDLGSLKRVLYGASPIAEAVLKRAMAALPGVEFIQAYGMTELSPVATLNPASCHWPENHGLGKLRSAGRACLCTEVRIADADDQEVARGTVGEILVRGPNVMLGYWNKPEETALALRGGWMHTGDGGYMDDEGFVFVVDRLKDMIVTGGENVYSAEVENVLAQHPAVAAVAVIGIPDPAWGEAVHACVVLRPDADCTAEALISHSRQLIAAYKCPRSVAFLDALPLSGAGKVLKTRLREPWWADSDRRVA